MFLLAFLTMRFLRDYVLKSSVTPMSAEPVGLVDALLLWRHHGLDKDIFIMEDLQDLVGDPR